MKLNFSLKQSWTFIVLLAVIAPVMIVMIWYGSTMYKHQLNSALTIERQANELLQIRIESEVKRYKTLLKNKSDPLSFLLNRKDKQTALRDINSLLGKIVERELAIREVMILSTQANVIAFIDPGIGFRGDKILSVEEKRFAVLHWGFNETSGSPEVVIPSLGRIYISSPKKHEGVVTFNIAVPIGNPAKAVLVAIIDVDKLWPAEASEEHGIGVEKTRDYILDRRGTLLTEIDDSEHKPGDLMTHLAIARTALINGEWPTDISYIGVINQPVYGTLTTIPSLSWTLVSEVITSSITQPIWKSLVNTILLTLLGLAIFVWLALYLASKTLRPIQHVCEAIDHVAMGDYQFVLEPPGIRELDAMTTGFNNMAKARKSAENLLQESEERFSLAVRGSNDGIWDWNLKSATIYFSPRWKQMLGYELDDIDNTFIAWRDLVHKDDLGRFLLLWTKYMEGQSESFFIEYRIRRKTGDYAWVLCRGSSTRDEAGHPARLSGSQTDITERQHLQKQLQQAQKMEAIGQLTGGIAHDFNNMLSGVLGFTELAREELAQYDNEKIEGYLSQVYNSGSRARDLVAQMLAFSRGGEGELEPCMLSPLIEESLKMLGSTLPSSIEIDLQLGGDKLTVMTNPVHLHQLIVNLCINARDAMEGKGHITIGLARVNDIVTECRSCHERVAGDYIQFFVRDTGSGIKPEQLDRIFDPFYTTKEVGKGSGMGLSMVHGIMHDHGGHIVVETDSGKGTTFTLFFPVIDTEAETVNTEDNDTKTSSDQTIDGNILVVDDEPSVGRFIGELLKGRGCQVTVETDSRSALSRFKKNPKAFDLVVTDQTMPNMTGAELAQSLLAIRPELPVILCTGYSDQLDEAGARSFGIKAYVNKPIETDEFLGLVRELLQAREIDNENMAIN